MKELNERNNLRADLLYMCLSEELLNMYYLLVTGGDGGEPCNSNDCDMCVLHNAIINIPAPNAYECDGEAISGSLSICQLLGLLDRWEHRWQPDQGSVTISPGDSKKNIQGIEKTKLYRTKLLDAQKCKVGGRGSFWTLP